MRKIAVAAAVLLGWLAVATAAPLELKDVSADAQWFLYVDVDAARSSKVMQSFCDACLKQCPMAKRWLDRIDREFGIDLREDLHSMLFFGKEFSPHRSVLIVRTEVDKKTLLKRAEKAPDHATLEYRDYTIHTWTDHKGTRWEHPGAGVFFKPDVLVFAGGVDLLKGAIDLLEGKGKGLAEAKSALAAAVPPGAIFVARASVPENADIREKCPVLGAMKFITYAEGEHEGHWFAQMTAELKTAEAAEQVKDILEGFDAMMALYYHDKPKVVALMKKTHVKVEGSAVHVTFRASVEEVAAAMPSACEAIQKWMKPWREKVYDGDRKERPRRERPRRDT